MKKSILLGVIALVMLVLAVPVMAAETAQIGASGSIVQSLSIATDTNAVAFDNFQVGMNEKDNIGTITVTSAFVPNWKVTAAASDGYGFMRKQMPNPGDYRNPLTNPFEQYNYNIATPGWVNAHGLTFSGSASTTMSESFRQNVLITDAPGTYDITMTYTIAAV